MSEGVTVSKASTPDGNTGKLLDAILIVPNANGGNKVVFAANAEISRYSNVRYAVGGFLLVRNGKVIPMEDITASAKPKQTGARTAIGIDKAGDTLTVVVVQAGSRKPGMSAKDIAYYLKNNHKAYHVLNLDNSGSSQFYFKNGSAVFQSLDGDFHPDSAEKVHRPIPNYLSIKVPHMTATPYYSD